MGQLPLPVDPKFAGNTAWDEQLKALRAAVEHLTRKEVGWALGVTDSALGDALFERDKKRWSARWTHVVKAMLAQRYDEVSRELLSALCQTDVLVTPFGIDESELMTVEDERDAYRRELAKTEHGKAAIARIAGKGRRR